MTNFTPEKCKQIALARLDIVYKWIDFRKQSQNKLQADYDFVKLHNTSNSYLFEILGKISRGSLHRWLAMLNGTEDYTKLLPYLRGKFLNDINNDDIKEVYNICQVRGLQYRRTKNTLALLNQLIKYFQNLGIIERKCVFQVKRLTDKNKFSINRIIFEV